VQPARHVHNSFCPLIPALIPPRNSRFSISINVSSAVWWLESLLHVLENTAAKKPDLLLLHFLTPTGPSEHTESVNGDRSDVCVLISRLNHINSFIFLP
jgi:hypothetical protein